eukprot:TRINITY_DN1568_c0_g1_i1.p1 TRINITY_DN1568_c0_g1~~TRINITY_DN1568_c0_g1_i1.p1  ORF type:complete len:876 (-),score=228.98 TRINITY_DN1568_c0_g1_i1:1299-3926(-)
MLKRLRYSSSLFRKAEDLRKSLSRSAAYGLLGVFFVYGTLLIYTYFLVRAQNTSTTVNTHCKDNPQLDYCQIPKEKKFDKFLLFATDCWPIKYAKDVLEHYADHSISYFVNIPGAKYSHAIYTAYFTGQLPTNYKGEEIKGDHFIRSLLRAENTDYKLTYIGPEWSFLAIWGKRNYDVFFENVTIEKESLDIAFTHPYPFFFERAGFMDAYLRNLKANKRSMFAHTGVFDHRQHGEHRGLGPAGKDFPRTDKMARTMQTDMKSIKGWIDQNPEYLLVLLSDHGVDEYGIGGYRMHGESADGNEPFIMLYNPRLEPKHEIRVDIVDVAPTLSFYFQGVDIPANSLGITRSYFGENQTELSIKALKQNLVQLTSTAKERSVRFDKDKADKLMELKHYNEEDRKEITKFLEEIKSHMFGVLDAPWISVALFTFVSSCAVLYILLQYNEGLERFVNANQYVGFVREMFTVLVIYGLMFFQLLFCWWNWGAVHDSGSLYRIFSPLLALVAIHNHRLSSRDAAKSSLIDRLVYKNEMINLAVIIHSTCFPDLMTFWDDIPGMSNVAFVLAVFLLNVYYRQKANQSQKSKYALERVIFSAVLLLAHVYSYTEGLSWLYMLWHFHVCALAVYLTSVFSLVFFVLRGRMAELIIPINLILFLLYKDSSVGRLLVLLLNYQYLRYILPSIEAYKIRLTECTYSSRDNAYLHNACLAYQAMIVYAINQTFFALTFSFGNKINFDAHPFAGRVGLNAYDVYPGLSAFLMAFHKYGIFALFAVFGWQVSQLRTREDEKPDTLYAEMTKISQWLADAMTAALLLLYALINLGTYIMFWSMSRYHPQEQAASMTLLVGIMSAFYCALHAISSYQEAKTAKHHELYARSNQ